MKIPSAIRIVLAGLATAAIGTSALSKACDTSYPSAREALTAWETRRDHRLAQAVVTDTLNAFCTTADDLIAEKKADKAAVEAAAAKVIGDYLDREADPKAPSRSLGSALRSHFGAAGFSRPQLKRLVTLSFKYTKDVDVLVAGDERFPRAKALLLPAGNLLVQGLLGKTVVCSRQVSLQPGVEAQFDC